MGMTPDDLATEPIQQGYPYAWMDAHHCEACGAAVAIIASGEGTTCYVPLYPGPVDGIPCRVCGARRRRDRQDRLEQDSRDLEVVTAKLAAAERRLALVAPVVEAAKRWRGVRRDVNDEWDFDDLATWRGLADAVEALEAAEKG